MAEKDAYRFKQIFGEKQKLIEALQEVSEDGYIPIWKMNIWKIRERLVIEGADEVFGAKKEQKVAAFQLYDGIWLVTLINEQ